ncbi:MAG: hypothetical protein MUF40_01075 [Gemmatimonadaceae bacterium]|nr:hypothetical protein [Gemmatimonadaceae bacterium]
MPIRRSRVSSLLAVLLAAGASTAPLAAQFEGCTWERCAARTVPGTFTGSARVVIGADTLALGWRGTEAAARLSRASEAAPHAARMRQARTIGVPIAVAAAITAPFALAALFPDGGFGAEPTDRPIGLTILVPTLVAFGSTGTWRAERELHHAIWRHNRQLALAIRTPLRDSAGPSGAACGIERCGLRVRLRGGFGGRRLVQGDHGPQVDLDPWRPGPVAALVQTTPGADADVARWADAGRESTLIGVVAVLGATVTMALAGGERWQRALVGSGIAVGGGLLAQARSAAAQRALEDAIWRHNGALAR